MSGKAADHARAERHAATAAAMVRRHGGGRFIWVSTRLLLLGIVAAMMLTSRPDSSDTVRTVAQMGEIEKGQRGKRRR
jgi:hypothetical protein